MGDVLLEKPSYKSMNWIEFHHVRCRFAVEFLKDLSWLFYSFCSASLTYLCSSRWDVICLWTMRNLSASLRSHLRYWKIFSEYSSRLTLETCKPGFQPGSRYRQFYKVFYPGVQDSIKCSPETNYAEKDLDTTDPEAIRTGLLSNTPLVLRILPAGLVILSLVGCWDPWETPTSTRSDSPQAYLGDLRQPFDGLKLFSLEGQRAYGD